MATTAWQNVLKCLVAHGGIVTSVENLKDYNPIGLTEKGKVVTECTEDNDVRAVPCYPRMLSAGASRMPVNIPIRTSDNRPTEGHDNTQHGC